MRILWVSSLAWYDESYRYSVNGPGAVSGSLYQQQLIVGLSKLGVEVDIITDYPYAERANREGWYDKIETIGAQIAIPSTKSYLKEKLTKGRKISKIVDEQINHKKYDFVVAYLIHTPYMEALKIAKKHGIRTVLICPDLPDMMDMSLSSKPIKRLLKRVDISYQNKIHKYIDGYVLFTKYMGERLPIKYKPWTVIEGVAEFESLDIADEKKEQAIMHAGTLHKNIGLENILEAFRRLPSFNMELWIFGDGELKSEIIKASKEDTRIKYFGFVDRKTLFSYEKKAYALINARNNKDVYTRYSFPSKTFEYMYSGTPFMTTWLDGIPDEYKDYLYIIPDNSPESIAKAMEAIIDESKLEEFGLRAREFVKTRKCKEAQSEKLLSFFRELFKEE